MSIIDRLTRLTRANINTLLDSAEDPQKMLDQILRDMEESITEAKQQVANMIAQEKLLESDSVENHKLADSYRASAEAALKAGNEALAREALRRQLDYSANANLYDQQLATQKDVVARMRDQLDQLQSKYKAAVAQRDTLVSRQRAAQAQKKVSDSVGQVSLYDPSADLQRIDRQIRMQEANAVASAEINADDFSTQFEQLDADLQVNTALEDLKSKMAALPASTTASEIAEKVE